MDQHSSRLTTPIAASPSPTAAAGASLPIWPAAIVTGMGSAVALWCAWFLMHMPSTIDFFPPMVAGPALLALLVVMGVLLTRGLPRSMRLPSAITGGLIAGLVTLMILGSKLTTPTSSAAEAVVRGSAEANVASVRPGAALIIAGFLLSCAIAGAIAGVLARLFGKDVPSTTWADVFAWKRDMLFRYAVIATIAIVPLLTLGGVVTSAKAGLAVPDWPQSYGANMLLYPISLMADPHIFLEHTHRLFGMLVGLTTLVLMAFTFFVDRRGFIRLFAVLLLVGVCLQGYLGGLRVTQTSQWLAVFHGVLGQIFLAATAAFTVVIWPRLDHVRTTVLSGAVRMLPQILFGSLVIQLIFGAMYRHLRSPHALWSHVVFSLAVLIVAVIAGSLLIRRGRETASLGTRRLGAALHGVVGIQFALGWVALLAVLISPHTNTPPPTADQIATMASVPAWEVLVRTLHQANGAALLATCTIAMTWAALHARAARTTAPAADRPAAAQSQPT